MTASTEKVSSTQPIELRVNGQRYEADIEPRMTLADCLRHELNLTGTHVGCEHGVCGVCTVIVNGQAVRSCLTLAFQAEGYEVTTVEGLSLSDGELAPLQRAFRKHHAVQCGFCTPGFLTSSHALLINEPDADEERILEVLSGVICRCTGYIGIVGAVKEAQDAYSMTADTAQRSSDQSTFSLSGVFRKVLRVIKK